MKRMGWSLGAMVLVGCQGGDLPDGDIAAGEQVFADTCAVCHGADGTGGIGPSLLDEVPDASDAELQDVIQNGDGEMPAQSLDDQQTADVIAYMRDLWG
jgi:mono/diheme cytochrome c family protein